MFEALPHCRRRSAWHPRSTPSERGRLALPLRGTASSNPDLAVNTEVPAVVFEAVSLAFDDNVALREVSFSVRSEHMTILLGASGSGKFVVLKLILGLLRPDSGGLRINGERIDTMPRCR